jgi:hypothetical protein
MHAIFQHRQRRVFPLVLRSIQRTRLSIAKNKVVLVQVLRMDPDSSFKYVRFPIVSISNRWTRASNEHDNQSYHQV